MPALKRFVTDYYGDYKLPQPTAPERTEKIAVAGSGPASLLCAYELRQKGYGTTIFNCTRRSKNRPRGGAPALGRGNKLALATGRGHEPGSAAHPHGKRAA